MPNRLVQAGLEADHVAIFVDYSNVTGVAVVAGIAVEDFVHGAIKRRRVGEFLGRAGAQFERRFGGIDELSAFAGVVFREKAVVGNLDVVHVAEIFFTIAHGEFYGFALVWRYSGLFRPIAFRS